MSIAGKVALIVGASGALGQAIAAEFARQGAIVALGSRSEPNAQFLQQLTTGNEVCKWFPVDVNDLKATEGLVGEVERELGPLHTLINASGVYGPIGPVEENDPVHWAQAVGTNIVGTFNLTHAVVPGMKRNGGGRIVHFSGGGGTYGRSYFSCYSACKAAVVRFTESVGKELQSHKIFINAIAPGPVRSAMWEQLRAAGAAAGGEALEELKSMDQSGGVPAERAAQLALRLASTDIPIAGRVISAVWDDWERLEQHADELLSSDAWTLRRVSLVRKP